MTAILPLEHFVGKHEGATIAILGNGPSLALTGPRQVYNEADIVIGVNRVWDWGPLDYWLWIDGPKRQPGESYVDIYEQAKEHMTVGLFTATWIFPTQYTKLVQNDFPKKTNIAPFPMQGQDDLKSLIKPGMLTKTYFNREERGGSLMRGKTTVIPSIHLALTMGAAAIKLFGCDNREAPDGSVNHVGDAVMTEKKRTQLDRAAERLDLVYDEFHETVELTNCSPGYDGLSMKWPKGEVG